MSNNDVRYNLINYPICERWIKFPFEKSFKDSGTFVKLKKRDFNSEGKYPVVDQGEEFISGYVDDSELLYKGEKPIVIFGDHTTNIKYIDFDFAVGADGTKILAPINGINPKFLYYFLKSVKIPHQGYSRHFKYLKSLDIPLAPLKEQKRIADKLDEAFVYIDKVKARMDAIPELIKEFRKMVLSQAVSGKLTEKWREENNLGEWQSVNSAEVFELVTSGSRGWAKYYTQDSNQLFVRITNMDYGTYDLDLSPSKLQFLNLPENSEGKRTLLKANDILISITGDVGMISLVPEKLKYEAYVNQHVCLARPKEEINAKFIAFYLMSEDGFGQFQNKKRGATKDGLTLTDIRSLSLNLPETKEQDKIVERIDELLSVIDTIELKYSQVKDQLEDLPNQLLSKAFKGELVEPDLNDEPAEKLLERIKEEMEKLKPTKRKTK